VARAHSIFSECITCSFIGGTGKDQHLTSGLAKWRRSDYPSGAFLETVSDSPNVVQLNPPLRQAAVSLYASRESAVG